MFNNMSAVNVGAAGRGSLKDTIVVMYPDKCAFCVEDPGAGTSFPGFFLASLEEKGKGQLQPRAEGLRNRDVWGESLL